LFDTEFAKTLTGEKISPTIVAEEILKELEADQYEIQIGATASLYRRKDKIKLLQDIPAGLKTIDETLPGTWWRIKSGNQRR
jgi:hypothetical protein